MSVERVAIFTDGLYRCAIKDAACSGLVAGGVRHAGYSCDGRLLPDFVCVPGCARCADISVFAIGAVSDCLWRVDIDSVADWAG